jgi:hypothetical protein
LILQRAKERRALAIKQQPITVSESTADLVLNMEETARRADTPDHEKVIIHFRLLNLKFYSAQQQRNIIFLMLNICGAVLYLYFCLFPGIIRNLSDG